MRRRSPVRGAILALMALGLTASLGTAQSPLRRLKKLKESVKKTIDTVASGTAARVIDSSKLAKPLAPVAAILDGRLPCAADTALSVGTTVVSEVKRDLALGDTTGTAARNGGSPCATDSAAPPASAAAAVVPGTMAAPVTGPASGAAAVVGTAIVAAPIVRLGAKSLFGDKPRTASDVLKELIEKGRVTVKGFTFLPASDRAEPVPGPFIEPVAEALAAFDGKIGVHVCLEENPRLATPDTALVRRRMERVWATLLSVGAPDRVFAPLAETPLDLVAERHPAKLGRAEVELVLLPEAKP